MGIVNAIKKDVALPDAIAACHWVAQKISAVVHTSAVVCIGSGGLLPAYQIATRLAAPLHFIRVEKDTRLPLWLQSCPWWCWPLQEAVFEYKCFTSIPSVTIGLSSEIRGHVIVVDDVVHTGNSINVARNYLMGRGVGAISTASLSFVSRQHPDFFWAKGRFRFPWCVTSPSFAHYLNYIQTAGIVHPFEIRKDYPIQF